MLLRQAVVRSPGANFADGLTTVSLGKPDYKLARLQHQAYCEALEQHGLTVTRLDDDEEYPDSTFVEDTAILTPHCAVLTRPGAPTRAGELKSIEPILKLFFSAVHRIEFPGTVDGGDVCQCGDHFLIGISRRTNQQGAGQLAELLLKFGYTSELIDIRNQTVILHLKSGIAYLGEDHLVVIDALRNRREFDRYSVIKVPAGEEYAANCVRVNDAVLVAAGYPEFEGQLRRRGFSTVALDISEFQKMDGGLSCLSLRF